MFVLELPIENSPITDNREAGVWEAIAFPNIVPLFVIFITLLPEIVPPLSTKSVIPISIFSFEYRRVGLLSPFPNLPNIIKGSPSLFISKYPRLYFSESSELALIVTEEAMSFCIDDTVSGASGLTTPIPTLAVSSLNTKLPAAAKALLLLKSTLEVFPGIDNVSVMVVVPP